MSKAVGRPRSQAADAAIFKAAYKLFLVHSYVEVSMEMLAQEAGVSKATLYRRYANKAELAVHFLVSLAVKKAPDFVVEGSYKERLTLNLRGLRDLLAGAYADVVAGVIAQSQHDKALREQFIEQFLRPVQAIGDRDLAKAVEDGELAVQLDQDLLFDQMFGFFYYRLLVADRDITNEDIERVVNLFLGD